MDEAHLRQQICHAAHQLWVRGLIVGDSGTVTVQLHRRRFLATPPGVRRANLHPDDLICVDMGGLNIQGDGGLSESDWRLHRAAYRSSLDDGGAASPGSGRARSINATILAEPAPVMAMMAAERDGDDDGELQWPGCEPVPVLGDGNEQALAEALRRRSVVAVRHVGVLAAAETLAAALNQIERVDHAARIQCAAGNVR